MLERTGQGGGPIELLIGQQAEGVPAEHAGPLSTNTMLESSVNDDERRQQEVGLGLSTTGRKPDEVDEIAPACLFV
ncbi:MAG: hypothetical protein VYC04_01745 [Actinomycetota bacterium]|nr:hypothetical protein [Actinomycetota bacterium]